MNILLRNTENLVLKMLKQFFLGILLAMVILASIEAANAGLVNVQFDLNSNDPEVQVGSAVIGSMGDVWNMLLDNPDGGSASSLVDSNGVATGINLTYGAGGSGETTLASTVWDTDYRNLMRGYLYSSTLQSVGITGLLSSSSYDLYIYTQGNSAATGRQLSVTPQGGATVTSDPANASANTFMAGQNYLQLSLFSNASGEINFDYAAAAGEANINGFQLLSNAQAVSEPSSLVLLISGSFFGISFYRRQQRGKKGTDLAC